MSFPLLYRNPEILDMGGGMARNETIFRKTPDAAFHVNLFWLRYLALPLPRWTTGTSQHRFATPLIHSGSI